jgi:Xaa-Pro aminopeptidase
MKHENILIVADSHRDANMLYAVRLFVPEAFIFLRTKGEKHLLLGDSDLDRVRRLARDCQVHALSKFRQREAREAGRPATTARIIKDFLRGQKLRKVSVPPNFPYGLARQLRHLKLKIKVKKETFFPERALKTPDELKKISAALIMAEVGLAEGIQALKRARIARNGRLLVQHNVPLTAEKLRSIISVAILQAGGSPCHVSVSSGEHGCDPHELGNGVIHANEPVTLGVSPRSQKTGYYGDLSRTVVRGRPSEEVRRMFHTVIRAQDAAFARLLPGTYARLVHAAVQDLFDREGFHTSRRNGHSQGFLHATGHGLGLDPSEGPFLDAESTDVLQPGHVTTVGPGLFYHPAGNVRLHDVAVITDKGARNLTEFEKVLEI